MEEHELERVRDQVTDYLEVTGKSRADLAKMAAISSAALSQFMSNTYKASPENIVKNLLDAIGAAEKREAAVVAVKDPKLVETAVKQEIDIGLDYVTNRNDILVITGPPGIGKTKTLEQFIDENPTAIFITATPNCCSPSELLNEILDALGKNVIGRRQQKEKIIYQTLRKSNRVLLVDEGHFLTFQALETLRCLHDATKCPVVVCGNPKLWEIINDRNTSVTGQFFSRAVRMDLTGKVSMEDVTQIIQQNGMELSLECLEKLHEVANKIGGLRVMVKLFLYAWTIANNQKPPEPLGIKHIQAASPVIIPLPR